MEETSQIIILMLTHSSWNCPQNWESIVPFPSSYKSSCWESAFITIFLSFEYNLIFIFFLEDFRIFLLVSGYLKFHVVVSWCVSILFICNKNSMYSFITETCPLVRKIVLEIFSLAFLPFLPSIFLCSLFNIYYLSSKYSDFLFNFKIFFLYILKDFLIILFLKNL